jgi:hypothetical protein
MSRSPMNDAGLSLHVFSLNGLPVPVALYLYTAANVVVLSFVPAALFSGDRPDPGPTVYPRVRAPWLLALGRSWAPRAAGGAAGVVVLAAVIAAGAAGVGLSAYVLWTWLWAALVPISALAGNVWTLVNPWAAIGAVASRAFRRAPPFTLPGRAGIWPAVAAYGGLALVALAAGPAQPRVIALMAAGYTALTLAGMACFGRDAWLTRCEAFTVLFSLVGRFAPVEPVRDENGRLQEVWLRPWGTGLLQRQRGGWDWIVFVVLLLSTLAFDGLAATGPWQAVAPAVGAAAVPLGLAAVAAAFLAVVAVFVHLVLAIAGARRDDLRAATAFALTLVPIALLYHTAFSWGVVVGGLRPVLPIRADAIWYVQLTLVVVGHAIAVYLAHLRAGERFRTARQAMLGQYPMVVLLVLYTMTSMWILAQPTTAVQ